MDPHHIDFAGHNCKYISYHECFQALERLMIDKDRHNLYIDIAERVAEESHARRRKVGSIIVKDGRIISMGWNGMPAGWDNNCEDIIWDTGAGGWLDPEEFAEQFPYELWNDAVQRNVRCGLKTKPEVLHAESNAIAKLAKSTESGENADLYITLSPCIECAKLIHQTGIKHVFYKTIYRDDAGIKFLKNSGVIVTQQ